MQLRCRNTKRGKRSITYFSTERYFYKSKL